MKIAAKVDKVDRAYWEEVIGPMIATSPNVEFIGEIGEGEKADFLGNADALLFPIDWPEPFGLVMIEAMACGTPVIAFRRGSAPEVIDDGVSGFLVDDVTQAVAAARQIHKLDRAKARETFERRFGIERVAREYTRIYRSLPGLQAAGRGVRQRNGSRPGLVPANENQRREMPIMLAARSVLSRASQDLPVLPNAAPKD